MSNPIITCSVRDTRTKTINLTGNDQVLIRNHSTAYAEMSATAQDGAVIDGDMFIIRNGADTIYGDSGAFEDVSSNVFTFSAADSKGRASRVVKTLGMVEYVNLTCNPGTFRINASGSVTVVCSGEYFGGSFGAATNSLSVVCSYQKRGSTWSSEYNMSVSVSGNTYTASVTITGLNYKNIYNFEFIAEDKLMTASALANNVSSVPVFHWGENDVTFEVPVVFKGDVSGNLRINGDSQYDNTLYFGDDEQCYIWRDISENDYMYIRADTLELDVDELTVKGQDVIPKSGAWTPKLSISGVDYSYQDGWYTKVGDVVTVGFYLKADCPSGYDDENIEIEGLPYAPYAEGSGGGICSGALVETSKNFLCFVAENSGGVGVVTLRAQDCDDTSGYRLGTSASALRYPDGELTLSGTISYLV